MSFLRSPNITCLLINQWRDTLNSVDCHQLNFAHLNVELTNDLWCPGVGGKARVAKSKTSTASVWKQTVQNTTRWCRHPPHSVSFISLFVIHKALWLISVVWNWRKLGGKLGQSIGKSPNCNSHQIIYCWNIHCLHTYTFWCHMAEWANYVPLTFLKPVRPCGICTPKACGNITHCFVSLQAAQLRLTAKSSLSVILLNLLNCSFRLLLFVS